MKARHYLPFLVVLLAAPAGADTTFGTTSKYAYGANTGWISFRHDQPSSPAGVVFGSAFLSGYAYAANTGWIGFGSGSPANGYSYSNTGSDFGVNHDGKGNLSGFAYSANTGWISFGWAPGDTNAPRVNLATGEFSGFAYSANTGWVNLNTGLISVSMKDADSDGDGQADSWEYLKFGSILTSNGITDIDGDGIRDNGEFIAGTNPNDLNSQLQIITQSHNQATAETTLEFTTTPTRLYRIEYSADLGISTPWAVSSLGVFAPDSGVKTTRTITRPAGSKMFFRVQALQPLQP